MAISHDEVKYIAGLARLTLTEEEINLYAQQLNDILGYIDQLNELDVDNIEPMSHVLDIINVMRTLGTVAGFYAQLVHTSQHVIDLLQPGIGCL